MDLDVNIEDNPHVLLGRGLWAISVGEAATQFDGDADETKVGFLAFHPVVNPVPIDHIDDEVSVDNVYNLENPPISLVFSSVSSAWRLIGEIEKVIKMMEQPNE